MMKPLVESLKRLYDSKQITVTKILELYQKGTINNIEKDYILQEGGK